MGPVSMFDAAVMTLMVGWPGLVVGAGVGALAWRRARIAAAVVLGAMGLILAVVVRLAL